MFGHQDALSPVVDIHLVNHQDAVTHHHHQVHVVVDAVVVMVLGGLAGACGQ